MRLLDLTLPSIGENLALDEALLVEVERGRSGPLLRLWEPDQRAVVLGASGKVHEDVDLEACRTDRIPIARRSSGGGTVVVGPGALNFAVVLARDSAPGLEAVDRAQHYVLDRVAQALRAEGLAVEVLGSGDLTVDRRKVAGSAQRRLKHHFLVHATVLYGFPLGLISRYLRPPARQPSYREGRPHADFVANLGLSRDRLVAALVGAWGASEGTPGIDPGTRALAAELVREKFADPGWTWRS